LITIHQPGNVCEASNRILTGQLITSRRPAWVAGGKVRFQGCAAARHNDHLHVEVR